ncbi:MAG: rhodanese-like domain-containing protein [Anaerolineales bacterium]|nr:rhodanese-like domain-containing protein [Anaerolineales bacterium]
MSKKFQMFLALFLALSMILSACGSPAAEPVVEATEAAVVEVATEAPVVEEAGLDVLALFTELAASLPADKAYGSVKVSSLNEELADNAPFILDVREAAEIEKDGYIEGTVNIPVRDVLNNLDKLPGLDEPIVVTCASGHRGGMVMAALKLLGYTNVRNLNGGVNAWKKAEYPVVTGVALEAPAVISAPIVDDQPLYEMLNDFLTNLPEGFYAIKSDKLAEELAGSDLPFIVDTRSQGEWDKDGYIEGSINLPINDFFANLDQIPADKDARIIVLCASGHRGSVAMMGLRLMGYTNVVNLNGGLNGWKAAGMPVVGLASEMAAFLTNLPADAGFYSVKADKLNEMLVENPPFIVDVRQPAEIETAGYIAGSVNIPIRDLLKNLDKLPAKDAKIVITCASGHRGSLGMMALRLLGYTDVVNLNGGLSAWLKAEFAVETGAPAAPVAGTAPEVDAARFAALDNYLSNLPEGFGAIKSPDFNTELVSGTVPFMLDVRTQAEWDDKGHIEGAVHVPVNDVPVNLAQLPVDKTAPIMVICASGHRGAITQMYLQFLGYTNVRNLNGGMNGWIAAELPVVK